MNQLSDEYKTDLLELHSRQRHDAAQQCEVFLGFQGVEAEGEYCLETHQAMEFSIYLIWDCWLKKLANPHQVGKLEH